MPFLSVSDLLPHELLARGRRVAAAVAMASTLVAGLAGPVSAAGVPAAPAAARIRALVPNAFHAVGPDVSSYQHTGPVDWRKVRKSRGFVIIKATEGAGYTNPYFAADWAAASRDKLPRGAYHFARPGWPLVTAEDQARAFAATVGPMGQPGDLPPVLDLEVSGGLGPGQLVLWSQQWIRSVRTLTGRTPMLYTYRNFWAGHMGDTDAFAADGIPLWIADYDAGPAPHLVGGWKSWTMWQYTSSGRQPGIPGRVDLSKFHGGTAAMRTFSSGRSGTVVLSPPAAPGVSASADSGELVVSWVPRADGWSAPTSWTVRIPEAGRVLTVDGQQSSVTIPGLPLGEPVTAVVTARNALGASPPSAPSAAVAVRAPTSLTAVSAAEDLPVGQHLSVRFQFASPGSPVSARTIRFWAVPAAGGAAVPLGSALTGAGGSVAVAVTPHQSIGIVAAFDGSQTQRSTSSTALILRVIPKVTLSAPLEARSGPVTVTCWTNAPAGTPVALEVASATGWVLVGRGQAASGGISLSAIRAAGKTRWRAVVLATAGSLRSQSNPDTTSVAAARPGPG